MHRKHVTRRGVQLTLATGLAMGAVGVMTPQSMAANPYTAVGSASAMRVVVADPDIVPLLEGGAVAADTGFAEGAADTVGGSNALASLQYPGKDIAGLPGLMGAFFPPGGPAPELPGYPVTVKADSSNPKPSAESGGAYELTAEAVDGTAKAQAKGGAPGDVIDNLRAFVVAAPTDGDGVKVTATSIVAGASIGTLVKLGTVESIAIAERTSDGTLKREATMRITGASIAGLPLKLENGKLFLPLLGTQQPLNEAIASNPLLKPLKDEGIAIEYQKPVETDNGIIAPGLKLTRIQPTPALGIPALDTPTLIPGQPAVGPLPPSTATVTYTFGFAEAKATLTPLPTFPPIDPTTPTTPVDPTTPTPPVDTGGGAPIDTGGGAPIDTGGSAPIDTGGETPVDTGGETPVDTGGVATGTPQQQQAVGFRVKAPFDALNIYLALVVVGLIALGTGQLARFQGVKTAWKS